MAKKFREGVDRLGEGYFGVPVPPSDALPADLRADPWRTWEIAVHRAKQGKFDGMPVIRDIYDPFGSGLFNRACVEVLGDAGPDSVIESLRREMVSPARPNDYDTALDYCLALSKVGKLADVPIILNAYKRHAVIEDCQILPVYISFMVEEEASEIADPSSAPSLEEYEGAVMDRYQDLVEDFGTDDVLLQAGERFSVRRLAEVIRDALHSSYFPSGLRVKFEAATGIDCRPFYNKRGNLQRLAASAIIEKFLDGPDVDRYEDGVRYFFGHRVPA